MGDPPRWLCVVSLLALNACDPGEEAQLGFFEQESPAYLRVHDEEAVCDTCIQASLLRILGDTVGPGSVFPPFWFVAKDGVGNYWVSQRGEVKVFTEGGRFSGTVGRFGQGPLEFGNQPRPFYSGPGGLVHIYDSSNQRITVVNGDHTLVREVRLNQLVFDLVGLPGTNRYVVNSWVESPELIGLPLHVMEGDSVIASFGLTQRDAATESPVVARRKIAIDSHRRIVAAKLHEYVIDVWSTTGTHLGTVEGPPLNQDLDRGGQLKSQIIAVKLDRDDRLWVVTRRPRPDWGDFMTVDKDGRVVMRPDATVSALDLYTHRVDVIELNTGLVIARLERQPEEGSFYSFIGSDEIVGFEPTPNGDLRLGIWILTLASGAEGR